SSTLTAENMAFLRTDSDNLKDQKTRQALVRAVSITDLVKSLNYPATLADSPLLRGELGYDPTLKQLNFDPALANSLLDEAGWKRTDSTSVRTRNGVPLKLRLVAQSTPDF